MTRWRTLVGGAAICAWSQVVSATGFTLDITSDDSIKSTAATLAYGMMKFYTGNNTGDNPGNLPNPYYWWEAGAMFGTMVEYWYYTGDATYNPVVLQALMSQASDTSDFMPENQTKTEGNDDQGYWGMAALTAAETKFENPPSTDPQWIALAQGIFNDYVTRWDETTCNGGLRWQIFSFNTGWWYKNSIANGCFFNIAARLARYTGNSTYAEWAEKVYDWETNVKFIGDAYQVYDGAGNENGANCSVIDLLRFSYNQGIYLYGAAVMYNLTSENASISTTPASIWSGRVTGLLNATSYFFPTASIMSEVACENVNGVGNCDTDQLSFKAYLSRYMAVTSQLAPFTASTITNYLQTSATAAVKQCVGGADGTTCGYHWAWNNGTWDGTTGVGQQMSALSVVQSLLIPKTVALVTNSTGGTSTGNIHAGQGSAATGVVTIKPATGADKAGAGILTFLALAGCLGGVGFMVS